MVRSPTRLRITLTVQQMAHFMGEGVALLQTVILHTYCKRKGNNLKRRREREREARQNESVIQKSKVEDKNT